MAINQLTTATWPCTIGRNESAPYDDGRVRAEVVEGRGSDRSCDLLTMQGFHSSMASDDLPAPCKALSWGAGNRVEYMGGGGIDWMTWFYRPGHRNVRIVNQRAVRACVAHPTRKEQKRSAFIDTEDLVAEERQLSR